MACSESMACGVSVTGGPSPGGRRYSKNEGSEWWARSEGPFRVGRGSELRLAPFIPGSYLVG